MNTAPALTVTPATAADIPRLAELLGLLFTQEADFSADAALQSRGLALIIGDASIGHVLVARAGTATVGMVNLLYTVSTALGARVALLEDLVVDPDWRGQGIGGQLLEAARALARQQGCERLTVLTDHNNSTARRLYTRHGFQGSAMIPLRCPLDPAGAA